MIEEEAIMYFKFHREIFCEDYLKNCPKDSIAYQATIKEQKFYDMAIKAIEQYASSSEKSNMSEIPTSSDAKYEAKAITRGNCMKCGKELKEGLFFCKECEAESEEGNGDD